MINRYFDNYHFVDSKSRADIDSLIEGSHTVCPTKLTTLQLPQPNDFVNLCMTFFSMQIQT